MIRQIVLSIPRLLRYLLFVVVVFVALAGLILLFEYAGGIIDTGGVVGE